MSSKTQLPIIFGAMTFGREGEEQVRTSNLDDCAKILDTFQSFGHSEVDTSRFYGGGSSEEYLASLDWKARGLTMDTKFFPNHFGWMGRPKTHLTSEDMRTGLTESLKALDTGKVDLWYLHGPDRSIPIADTLKAVNEMYKEGKFDKWGISNFMAWEVAQICEICKSQKYPLPSVYQGPYNPLHRTIEHELLPCLRKYSMSFYAFNPLAGGWLTSRYTRATLNSSLEPGSRFDDQRAQGKMYRARFWNEEYLTALEGLRAVKGELRESEVALRWIMHHGALKGEEGDKVIIGASSEVQLRENLEDFERGELDSSVLEALERGWEGCRGRAWKYFH